MPKSTPYLYGDALEKLAAELPTTKTALLCSLLLERCAALGKDAQTNLATALRRRPRYHLRNVLQTRSPRTQKNRAHPRRGAGKVPNSRNCTLNKLRPAWNTIRQPISEKSKRPDRVFIIEARKTLMSWCMEEGNPMSKANAECKESYRCLFSSPESGALALCPMWRTLTRCLRLSSA